MEPIMTECNSFAECVKNCFSYLLTEYGFIITYSFYTKEPWSDGIITFVSEKTIIEVAKDRNGIDVTIQPRGDPIISRINIMTILEVNNIPVKEINWKEISGEIITNKIKYNALLLQAYCLPEIEGDFSRWRNYHEFEINKLINMGAHPSFYKSIEEYIKTKWGK
jgi:hypothetical protein